ncbi:MAG TPA: KpsF/GutQ family sugar-phosphate isomerase [Gemmatimonadaceae bacterium]|nr:KpsF/GutQ family sugar-phosphate isomerase [Gemmatimonadaceae bacterium]
MNAGVAARGRRVLRLEAEAIFEAESRLGDEFVRAVEMIATARGRVIVCGVGKSGLIGRKIAATLTSTGTPAVFLHAADSIHGDLGIVGEADVAILISKSGESDELLPLLDHFKRLGVQTIAITGERESTLASHADETLDAWVREEACLHGLVPTTSTTVALALGDALAVALLEEKGFGADDFARFHPGGALGRKLLTRVRDVMLTDSLPTLPPTATVREAIVELAERRGIVMIIDEVRHVSGIMTAGDLTRLMEREMDVLRVGVSDVMNRSPRVADPDELGSAAVHRMEEHGIMAMPVIAQDGSLVGVVHLHDLMRAGVA